MIGDGNLNVYNEEDERIPPANPDGSDNEGRSWVALYLLETINRMDARKHSTGITDANVLYKAICENKLFKNTELRPYRFPIGWDGGGKIKNGPELSALELKIMKVRSRRVPYRWTLSINLSLSAQYFLRSPFSCPPGSRKKQ